MAFRTLLPALLPALLLAPFALLGCFVEADDDAASDDDSAADDDASDDDTTPEEPGFCAEQGLTSRAFDAAADGDDFDEVAPSFAVETLDGTFDLEQAWSGCDVYVFVLYAAGYDYAEGLIDSASDEWLESMPRNARFLFLSFESDEEDVLVDMEYVKNQVQNGLHRLSDDDRYYWRERMHYVTESARDLPGALGELVDDYAPYAFAIDRAQRWKEVGYLSDPNTGWARTDIDFTRYEVEAFNHQSDVEDALAAQQATVIRAFDRVAASDPGWAGESVYADVPFPDAATMAGFDTMEFDLTLACGGHPEYDHCPEWDYLVYAYLCDAGDPEDCPTEIGRWITTYARPGRWVHDVSPFLALLKDGGIRRIRFYTQQPYTVTLDVRLRDSGTGARPDEMQFLWTGGGWDQNYNTLHAPVTFTPPAGTTRVQLVAVTSGHGFGADAENCAEFCNHQHEFTVNGKASWTQEFPMAGSAYGCAEQVPIGTVPNQYGTWVYGRGGWCPGLEVTPWVADITSAVDLGGENTVSYRGLFEGEDYVPVYTGGDFYGRIDLVSYLVYSR